MNATVELALPKIAFVEDSPQLAGAKCFLSACDYFGVPLHGGGACENLLGSRSIPTPSELVAAFQDLGLDAGINDLSLSQLGEKVLAGMAVLVDLTGSGQYVVVAGIDPSGLLLMDPQEGYRRLAFDAWGHPLCVVVNDPHAERKERLWDFRDDGNDAQALAAFYAEHWNLLHERGLHVPPNELEAADLELAETPWYLDLGDDGLWRVLNEADLQGLYGDTVLKHFAPRCLKAGERSPKGGVTMGGKFYRGGQWIPKQVVENASPEDKEKLTEAKEQAHAKRASRGDVDESKLRAKLSPHARELSKAEQQHAAKQFRALHAHHGELTLHRLEELADEQENLLAKTKPNAGDMLDRQLRANLARLHAMIDMAKAKGVTGKLSDALNAAAIQYRQAKTKKERESVKQQALGSVRDAVLREAGIGDRERTEIDAGGDGRPGGGRDGNDAAVTSVPAATSAADAGRGDSESSGLTAQPLAEERMTNAALERYANREQTATGGGIFGGEDLQAREGFAKLPNGAPIVFTNGEFAGRTGRIVRDEDPTTGKQRIVAEVEGRPGLIPISPDAVEPLSAHLSWRVEGGGAGAGTKQSGLFGGQAVPEAPKEVHPDLVSVRDIRNRLNEVARNAGQGDIDGVPVESKGVGQFAATIDGKKIHGDLSYIASRIHEDKRRREKETSSSPPALPPKHQLEDMLEGNRALAETFSDARSVTIGDPSDAERLGVPVGTVLPAPFVHERDGDTTGSVVYHAGQLHSVASPAWGNALIGGENKVEENPSDSGNASAPGSHHLNLHPQTTGSLSGPFVFYGDDADKVAAAMGGATTTRLNAQGEPEAVYEVPHEKLASVLDSTLGAGHKVSVRAESKPGFTGIDAHGHKWVDGKQVKREDEVPPITETNHDQSGPERSGSGSVPEPNGRGVDRGVDRGDAGTGGIPSPGTPRIITARAEFTRTGDPALVPASVRGQLNDAQQQGVALAIEAMTKHGGFLCADSTGLGKTRQQLAVAQHFLEQGKKVVIVSPAEVIKPDWKKGTMAGSFANDSAAMGVAVKLAKGDEKPSPGTAHITTYNELGKLKSQVDKDTIVIFDESHFLKNSQRARAKHGKEITDKAGAVMYATATPGDKPLHIAHLARAGVFGSIGKTKTYEKLGMELYDQHVGGGQHVKTWRVDPRVGYVECARRLSGLFDQMTKDGLMVKRELSMANVAVGMDRVPLSDEQHAAIERAYEQKMRETGGNKAVALMAARLHQEPFKIPATVRMVQEELAAGRSPIIFVGRVNDIGEESEGGEDDDNDLRSAGTASSLKDALIAAGVPAEQIGELHGGATRTAQAKKRAMEHFQSGKTRAMIATVQSGGTGVNLDDTVGDKPRTVIMMTPPFTANDMAQAIGRVHRLNTKSDSKVRGVLSDTHIDDWNAGILETKFKMLGATVGGEATRGREALGELDLPPDLNADEKPPFDWGRSLTEKPAPPVKISGNTYEHKDRLKREGARWNGSEWEIPAERADKVRHLPGLRFSDTAADKKPETAPPPQEARTIAPEAAPTLDPELPPMSAARREAIHRGLRHLHALNQDRASERNGVGFNGMDTEFGGKLAEASSLTDKQAHAAARMLAKYKRQLGDELHAKITTAEESKPEPVPQPVKEKQPKSFRRVQTSRGERSVHTFSPSSSFWNARKAGKIPDNVTVRKNDRTGQWEATIWGANDAEIEDTMAALKTVGVRA